MGVMMKRYGGPDRTWLHKRGLYVAADELWYQDGRRRRKPFKAASFVSMHTGYKPIAALSFQFHFGITSTTRFTIFCSLTCTSRGIIYINRYVGR